MKPCFLGRGNGYGFVAANAFRAPPLLGFSVFVVLLLLGFGGRVRFF